MIQWKYHNPPNEFILHNNNNTFLYFHQLPRKSLNYITKTTTITILKVKSQNTPNGSVEKHLNEKKILKQQLHDQNFLMVQWKMFKISI